MKMSRIEEKVEAQMMLYALKYVLISEFETDQIGKRIKMQ